MKEENVSVDRLPELASKIEKEFSGRVDVQNPNLVLEDGETAVRFEPMNPAAAPLVVRFWFGVYSIDYANEFGLDSEGWLPADEAFEWTLDQVLRVARFGLVFITKRRLLGLLPDVEYVVPSYPQESLAFKEELQRRVRPVIRRTWEPW